MQVADGRLCKADSATIKSALVVPPATDNQTPVDMSNVEFLFGKQELPGILPPPDKWVGVQLT
jgi:hypothetical protein